MKTLHIRSQRAGISIIAMLFVVVTFFVNPTYALTDNQLNVLNQGIYYFNTEVNACLQGGATSTTSTALVGSDNIEKAFNFFVGKGLTPLQTAGILGNLKQESGINPVSHQTANAWSDLSDAGGEGVGIAQWDGGRRPALINTAKDQQKDPQDLTFQLDYLWKELTTTYAKVLQNLKAATSVENAVNQFVGPDNYFTGQPVDPTTEVRRSGGYENPGKPQMQHRLDYATQILAGHGNSSGCGVNCSGSGGATTASNLSSTRQQVVCLAQKELAAWTPTPAKPRLQYTKYTDGWMCNGGAAPQGSVCANGNEFWCADFASWVYKQAGYPFTGGTTGGWRLPAVQSIRGLPDTDHRFIRHDANGYTPVPGDLAIWDQGGSHVNIVTSVTVGSDGSITDITFIGGDQDVAPYGGPESASLVSKWSGSLFKIEKRVGTRVSAYISPAD